MFFAITACTSIPAKWQNSNKVYFDTSKLLPGDILIVEKKLSNPMSWFGHSAIVMDDGMVGEYPEIGYGFFKHKADVWLEDRTKDRQLSVLRFKYIDPRFRNKLRENMNRFSNKNYSIVRKGSDRAFYCSQFIWFMYYKTALELNYSLDIDTNKGLIVTPYDLLNSKYFIKVEI